jgi:hypothetical protein
MADQRITELTELAQGGVASNDVLPIADVSASQTKKVQVKSLIQAGFNLADASTLDISKINQGSVAKLNTAAIADNAITYGKIQQVSATDRLLGRSSAGAGNVEEIICTSYARSLLDDADAASARTTLSLGVVATGDTINTALLEDESVTSDKLASGSVVTVKLADSGVTGDKIAAATISGIHILDSGITQNKLASGAILAENITDSGITQIKLASGSVDTVNLVDSCVTTIKVASGAITAVKLNLASGDLSGSVITASSIPSGSYAASSIVTADIADDAVTTAKIANDNVTTDKILDGNVTTVKLASGAVATERIADSAVTTAKINDNAVSYSKIQSVPTDVLIGRSSAGSGNVEEIACTSAARSILDDASIADIRTTLGLGTLATQNGSFSGTSTGTNTGDQTITLSGDATGTGTSGIGVTIANSAITTAKINDGAVTTAKITDSGVTAIKLADNSAAIIAGSSPIGNGTFLGQQWFNTGNGYEYTWNGTSWQRQSGLATATISGDTVYSFTTSYPDAFSAEIAPSLNTQVASRFFAGPASGSSDAAPTFRAITADDLPKATTAALGVAQAGTGLVTVSGIFNHANSVASGVYYKVTVDEQGHISAGEIALVADDIPVLPASKITTGTFGSGVIGEDAVRGLSLADYSVSKFGEALPNAEYIGQFFFNPLEKDLYLWDGNVWNPVGISVGEIIFGGTYNASGNTIASTSSDGAAIGLSVGQPLPSPSETFNRYYVVVESGGTGTSPAPTTDLQPPDLLLCNGTAWVEIDVSSTYTAQAAVNVAFTPAASLGSTNVQSALEEVSNECRNVNNVASGILATGYGGTSFNSYTKGDILVGSGTTLIKQAVGTNGQVLTANSAFGGGVHWVTPASGTVLSVSVNSPLTVVSGTTNPVISIPDASTSVRGSVQLTDSTSTTSSSLAATATAVKSAYDLANAALPKAGGTITGEVVIGTTGTLLFEGSTDNAFEIQLAAADATSDKVITLPDTTGTVVTTGDTGTVTNTMLAGSIADTKLSTISTAGKVSNSATTATSSNTASAIVARDASGNFSAGTIDATIDEGTF